MKFIDRLFIAPKDYKNMKNDASSEENTSKDEANCLDYVVNFHNYNGSFEVTDEEFEEALENAYENLPNTFKNKLQNITIVIEKEAIEPFKSKLPKNTELLGLYVGVPLPKRNSGYGYGNMPDIIYIFQNPIERTTGSKSECLEQVRKTLWHEVGHYFGLDDMRLRELGY